MGPITESDVVFSFEEIDHIYVVHIYINIFGKLYDMP